MEHDKNPLRKVFHQYITVEHQRAREDAMRKMNSAQDVVDGRNTSEWASRAELIKCLSQALNLIEDALR